MSTHLTRSWVPVPDGSPFPITNLPLGVVSGADGRHRVATAIGAHALPLAELSAETGLPSAAALAGSTLDGFLALGRPAWQETRAWLAELLADEEHRDAVGPHLLPLADVRTHLPFTVADYVDFYSSEHHAMNVGRMFRPQSPALPAAWRHLPIAYHGRAGTVVCSGTDVVRPRGLRRDEAGPAGGRGPDDVAYGPSRRLDVEAEVGFVVGRPSPLGQPVPVSGFADHVFGAVLLNDWSARDVQRFESVPLGPFLGKSFATSISAWVVPLDALQAARVPPPPRDPSPAPHLADVPGDPWGLDVELVVSWNGTVVSRPPFASMYWTPAQQLAHLTSNGASLRTGDLFASGTVSGPRREQRGCFLELCWDGAEPVTLADGSQRTFLADGDEVAIEAWAPGPDRRRIGFGSVTGRVLPARG